MKTNALLTFFSTEQVIMDAQQAEEQQPNTQTSKMALCSS
jgi:hypothetical protein